MPPHPLFLVGFRPFFTLALLAGVVLPLGWVLLFTGAFTLPASALPPVQWHAHEMLFGFGGAVLGGFLLTASKNWVKIRGLHGRPLAVAAGFWLIERVAVLTAGMWPAPVRLALMNAFWLFVAGYVVRSLVRHRTQDAFTDNAYFVVALPLLLVAKNLLLTPAGFVAGATMALGLFRTAFVVMFERTFPVFMKAAAKVELPAHRALNAPIKALMLAAVFQPWLPGLVASGVLLAAAAVLAIRFFLWKPALGLKTFPVAVMYVGYLGLVAHLALEALRLQGILVGLGAIATHAFAFLTMGVVISAMVIRVSLGHTGRPIAFTASDRVGFGLLGLGAFFRLVATQLWPAQYPMWISLAGVGWALCFALIGLRLLPFLWRPRVDGKEH